LRNKNRKYKRITLLIVELIHARKGSKGYKEKDRREAREDGQGGEPVTMQPIMRKGDVGSWDQELGGLKMPFLLIFSI